MKFGKKYSKSGEISVVIIALTVLFILVFLMVFGVCITYINMYSIVYNYKMDLYNLNKSAIMSVNKVEGKFGIYEYNKDRYEEKFLELLKIAYNLNEELKNGNRYIQEVKILEYNIYKSGDVDSCTNKKINEDTIHVVTSITYNPIIFKKLFPNNCTFTIHNDISIKIYE